MVYASQFEHELQQRLNGMEESEQHEVMRLVTEQLRATYHDGHIAGRMVTDDNLRMIGGDIAEMLDRLIRLEQQLNRLVSER